jgi:hypothetical protein
MTIWRMRIACWIPKATNTHSEYLIFIVFPLQQLLFALPSMLVCAYFACLVMPHFLLHAIPTVHKASFSTPGLSNNLLVCVSLSVTLLRRSEGTDCSSLENVKLDIKLSVQVTWNRSLVWAILHKLTGTISPIGAGIGKHVHSGAE